jgi:hypothetical protein
MSMLLMLAMSAKRDTITETFTSNSTWTAPVGVTLIDTVVGKGANGTPGSTTTSWTDTRIDRVSGVSSGTGKNAGAQSWSLFQDDAPLMASRVNSGGSGGLEGVIYTGYIGTNTHDIDISYGVYFDAIPGTASYYTTGGWKSSGIILSGDYGESWIRYQRTITVTATTGANATAFGKTFPGGAGGPAIPASYSAVPVTPGQSYPIVVPSGGSVTITYQK